MQNIDLFFSIQKFVNKSILKVLLLAYYFVTYSLSYYKVLLINLLL
jgi:hypothetical protein